MPVIRPIAVEESRFAHDFTRVPAHARGAKDHIQGVDEEPVRSDEGLLDQQKPAAKPEKPAEEKKPAAVKCAHPVKATSTLMDKDLDFGLRVKVTWDSSTGKLSDLAGGLISEHLKYSVIPNPPFGKSDGKKLPESGTTKRIPSSGGLSAEDGMMQDTHQHPRSLVRSPASKGIFIVDQTYDYHSAACGPGWMPFVKYKLTRAIVADGKGFRFQTTKEGAGGPFKSNEAI